MKDRKLTLSREEREDVDEEGISIGRIMSFSDGVFAVAITLLVLSFKVPIVRQSVADEKLPGEIMNLLPIFEAYVISFLVVGLFWVGHHQVFRVFKRHDRGLLWLNLLFLMTIVFVPFPTSLMSEYPDARVAIVFYAVSIALSGVLLCLILWYGVHDHRLVDKDMDRIYYRRFMFGYGSMAAVFLVSVPLSFINAHFARLFWIAIVPLNFLFDHFLVTRLERRRAAQEEGNG